MTQQSTSSSGGVGVYGLLGVAFVVLKLCEVIDWSWWWVTAPFWGPVLAVIVFLIIYVAIALVKEVRADRRLRDRELRGLSPSKRRKIG